MRTCLFLLALSALGSTFLCGCIFVVSGRHSRLEEAEDLRRWLGGAR